MVVQRLGLATTPHPFVRCLLHGARDKGPLKAIPEVAPVAIAVVFVQRNGECASETC